MPAKDRTLKASKSRDGVYRDAGDKVSEGPWIRYKSDDGRLYHLTFREYVELGNPLEIEISGGVVKVKKRHPAAS